MATPKKITDKIDTLKDLLEAISEELESINWDFVDLEDKQVPEDLAQITESLLIGIIKTNQTLREIIDEYTHIE
jgi:hypothetical protein